MVVEEARHAWVCEDVCVTRHDLVLWERPVLLRATCMTAPLQRSAPPPAAASASSMNDASAWLRGQAEIRPPYINR